MTKGREIINKVIDYFNKARQLYPEITNDMLVDGGDIYYMNGNDGTEFDWFANDMCCEFYVFYNSTEKGFIKVIVKKNDTIHGYVYLDEGRGEAIDLETYWLEDGEACYLASLLFLEADQNYLFDRNINRINFDRKVYSYEMLNAYGFGDDEY